jgi:serine protease Do
MKSWFFGVTLAVLLVGGTAFNGLIYQDTQGKMAAEQQKVDNLAKDLQSVTSNYSTLQNYIGSVEGSLDSLESSLGDLSRNISTLGSGITGLNNKVTAIEATTTGLGGDLNGLKSSVTGLNASISSINNNLTGIQGNVANLQGNVTNLQGNVSSLQNSLTDIKGSINDLEANGVTVAEVAAKLEASVVKVVCNVGNGLSGGSGVIVRSNGYVLTNYHVVQGATAVTVTLNTGEVFRATVAGLSAARDLAVLKLDTTRKNFSAAVLGTSASCCVGEAVIAMGFPLLFDPEMAGQASFTLGIVSAKRTFSGFAWLQTDASINRGNSGGPLVNMKGEVIGINTLRVFEDDDGYPIDNIGFAIPIDDAKAIIVSAAGAE